MSQVTNRGESRTRCGLIPEHSTPGQIIVECRWKKRTALVGRLSSFSGRSRPGRRVPGPFQSDAVGVGQHREDKKAFPPVRSPNVLRREQSCLNIVPKPFEVQDNLVKAKPDVSRDVFKKADRRLDLPDNSTNLGPQVARIIPSTLSTGDTERLARVSRSDDIHDATPRLAVEGSQIRPQRRRIQKSLLHAARQDLGGERFPFNATDDASKFKDESKPKFASTASGAEWHDADEVTIHTTTSGFLRVETERQPDLIPESGWRQAKKRSPATISRRDPAVGADQTPAVGDHRE